MKSSVTKKSKEKERVRQSRSTSTPVRDINYEPVEKLLALHHTIGNRAIGQAIQAKLTIGQPNDKYEQEADNVADQIMRIPDPSAAKQDQNNLLNQTPVIQRVCPGCEGELQCQPIEEIEEGKEKFLQAKDMQGETPEVCHDMESMIKNLRGEGKPLSSSDRDYMEPRYDYDFSQVRVHNYTQAADAASSINARAFTLGNDIVFGSGQYSPGTEGGRHLLAH